MVHSNVIVVAVVRVGVTPTPQVMLGVTVPLHRIVCAPVGGAALELDVEKKDAVPEPPVPAGKLMFAAGDILAGLPPVTVQPPVVLATLTLV